MTVGELIPDYDIRISYEVRVRRTGILSRKYSLLKKTRRKERMGEIELEVIDQTTSRTPLGLLKIIKPLNLGHPDLDIKIY